MTDAIAMLLYQRNNPGDLKTDYNGDGKATMTDIIAMLIAMRDGVLTPVEGGGGDVTEIEGIELINIPAGSFERGKEGDYFRPLQTVSISAFQLGKYEITQSQYEALTDTNPSHFAGNPDYPVERVGWYEAALYCNLLSEAAGLEQCYDTTTWSCDFSRNGFRLPTEAEWVYACRAGTTTKYYTGDTESDLARAAWYSENSLSGTHPGGQREPNAFGLYDMFGNVAEWCNDWFDMFYYQTSPAQDPTGIETPNIPGKVIMGGSWLEVLAAFDLTKTTYTTPLANNIWKYGFRVARRAQAQ
ncbi:MAG: formylglycine-generating enzyme family protein [Candidatus Glassbacteria bacterium]|nr:formylglycine-generating enzyme family protein [Candidatus Glassbacteria bacterium]